MALPVRYVSASVCCEPRGIIVSKQELFEDELPQRHDHVTIKGQMYLVRGRRWVYEADAFGTKLHRPRLYVEAVDSETVHEPG